MSSQRGAMVQVVYWRLLARTPRARRRSLARGSSASRAASASSNTLHSAAAAHIVLGGKKALRFGSFGEADRVLFEIVLNERSLTINYWCTSLRIFIAP